MHSITCTHIHLTGYIQLFSQVHRFPARTHTISMALHSVSLSAETNGVFFLSQVFASTSRGSRHAHTLPFSQFSAAVECFSIAIVVLGVPINSTFARDNVNSPSPCGPEHKAKRTQYIKTRERVKCTALHWQKKSFNCARDG